MPALRAAARYQLNLNSLLVDIAEHSRETTGIDSSGAHFALLALTNKLGYAFAIGVAYPGLQALGFRAGQPLSAAAESALLAIGLGLTAVLLMAGGVAPFMRQLGNTDGTEEVLSSR